VNWHLTASEAAYVIHNCEARVLIASATIGDLSEAAANLARRLMFGGIRAGFEPYDDALDVASAQPLDHEEEGQWMVYSSGTTGRPKGILRPFGGLPYGSGLASDHWLAAERGFGQDTVYLCPAPLYHAAPGVWSTMTIRHGGTAVVLEAFDPELALACIERYRVTHAQFVPTTFVRMLKLPPEIRNRYDLSSLRRVIHAAAPCPIHVKEQMLDWWGPVVFENAYRANRLDLLRGRAIRVPRRRGPHKRSPADRRADDRR
jgi:long-chain acyl-CoA synthetase